LLFAFHVGFAGVSTAAVCAVRFSHICEEGDVMEVGCCLYDSHVGVSYVNLLVRVQCMLQALPAADVSAAAVRTKCCEPHLRGRGRHGGGLLLYDRHVGCYLLLMWDLLVSARQLYALFAFSHICEEGDVMEVGCYLCLLYP
jgi:hypothetical protein